MKLFQKMFGGKSDSFSTDHEDRQILTEDEPAEALADNPEFAQVLRNRLSADKKHYEDEFEADDEDLSDQDVEDEISAAAASAVQQETTNIWDIEDGSEDDQGEAEQVAAPSRRNSSRGRNNRTRLIGFESSESSVLDLFEKSEKTAPTKDAVFPVGWILVIEGPGRGHCFTLVAGMAQIGRGEDQAVRLDFGDNAISRDNHAAVVYDPDSRGFLLGHGGKANIVRLNGTPVIANEALKDGDLISIGETTLQLKTLCGPEFDWTEESSDEDSDDDVAIA